MALCRTCHTVIPCHCHLKPAADHADLHDRIAALFRSAPGEERLGDATPGEIADAVLAAAVAAPVQPTTHADDEALRSDLYDALDSYQQQFRISGLQHAQIRDHLATFLTDTLLRRMAGEEQPAPLRAELKPWQLLADQPAEPLPQTERVVGGRRLRRGEEQPATETRVDLASVYRELADEAANWLGVITEKELRRKARKAEAAVVARQDGATT